jgi:hypothetical protein
MQEIYLWNLIEKHEQRIHHTHAEINDAKKIFNFVCALEDKAFNYEKFYLDYRNNILGNNNVYLIAVDIGNKAVGYISCHGQPLLHHGGTVYEINSFSLKKHGANRALE